MLWVFTSQTDELAAFRFMVTESTQGNRPMQKEFNVDTSIKVLEEGFPGGAVVENLPANAGNTGSSPGLGRSHMPRSN